MIRIFIILGLSLFITTNTLANSDSELRKRTKIGFITKSIGLDFDYGVIQPFSLGYYPTPDQAVAVEYGGASFDFDPYDVFYKFSGSYQHIALLHRWFLFEGSFNLKQSISQNILKTDIQISIEDKVNTPFQNSDYTYTHFENIVYLYGIGIGNQWNFSYGIIVGIDYVWKQFVLQTNSKSSITTDSETQSAALTQAEKNLSGFEQTINNLQTQTGVLIITLGIFF